MRKLQIKKKQNITSSLILLFSLVLLSACAVPVPDANYMIPSVNQFEYTATAKTLKIGEVTGGEKTDPMGRPLIGNEEFQEALISTLRQSGIFKKVNAEIDADYELIVKIISQKTHSGFTINSTLFVNYRLNETKSNQEIWKENIFSKYDIEFSESFAGVERAKKALEGAARINFNQLLRKLSDVIKFNPNSRLPK